VTGDDCYAEVNFLALVAHGKTPVLGTPAFGDIHVAQDFEAADDRGLHLFGELHERLKHPVDAQARLQALFVGFEMQITGAAFDGLGENLIHQIDDRAV
jgi:hypothetical protein